MSQTVKQWGYGQALILALMVVSCSATHDSSDTAAPVRRCRTLVPSSANACTVQVGSGDLVVLEGDVLAPKQVLLGGQIVISLSQKRVIAVGCDADTEAGATGATRIVCSEGVISPGLVNPHDHLWWNQEWPAYWGDVRFNHRNQWRLGLGGHQKITYEKATDIKEVVWSEMRHILAGTTSIAGANGSLGFLRNVDVADLMEGLPDPQAHVADYNIFPLGDESDAMTLTSGCAYPKMVSSDVLTKPCFVPHIGEGIDRAARNELLCLSDREAGGVDATGPNGAFIHTVAALAVDAQTLRQRGTSVVWSPRSNISLYGNTAQVTMYDRLGINIALSTDWTPSGSMNLLRELRCAMSLNNKFLDGYFSTQHMWEMVTGNAADALQMSTLLGRLRPGLMADVAIFDRAGRDDRYAAVVEAEMNSVLLVLRGGTPLYGTSNLLSAFPGSNSACEPLPGGVCGAARQICSLGDTGLAIEDLISANKPHYPLFYCGTPADEPSCFPERPGEYPLQGALARQDYDGDGIINEKDNCRKTFNPIRPVDNGFQADADGDGLGDVCDPTPLAP